MTSSKMFREMPAQEGAKSTRRPQHSTYWTWKAERRERESKREKERERESKRERESERERERDTRERIKRARLFVSTEDKLTGLSHVVVESKAPVSIE